MAAFDGDAEMATRYLGEATTCLAERDTVRRSGGNTAESSSRARTALTKAEKVIEKLAAKMRDETDSSLSQKELQRRRDILRKARSEVTRLRALEKTVAASSDRDALLGASGGIGGRAGGADADSPRQTPEQLLMRTQGEMKSQDAILDQMSKGLDSLKTIGVAIRDETDLHVRLLDDLEKEVDAGNAGLKRETARAEHITADTKTCWLYVAICILLLVLVALVASAWA